VVLPAIMAWNTGSRPIFLCRAGETQAMELFMKHQQLQKQQQEASNTDQQDQPATQKIQQLLTQRLQRKRSDRLGQRGLRFRDALCEFIEKEGTEFMNRRNDTVMHPTRVDTGTSISGLYEERDHPLENTLRGRSRHGRRHHHRYPTRNNKPAEGSQQKQEEEFQNPVVTPAPPAVVANAATPDDASSSAESNSTGSTVPSFPCLVMSSTMPRAIETASWKTNPFPVKDVSNLNPLDMGDFAGMDLATIREEYPEWYEQLQREPFYTRFPGGESYSDLIDRLYPIIIDIEQQLGLAVVVSHVSVLQVLVSYFRGTPIQECMDIEIPMHTVLKFTPLRGGGWMESKHALLPDDSVDIVDPGTNEADPEPIWTDSRSCLPRRLSIQAIQT
jgi:broad specificity phosphatase PhoE